MLKASDVKGLVPEHKEEAGFLVDYTKAVAYNAAIDETSFKEFYLDRENLAKIKIKGTNHNYTCSDDFIDAILQSFNAGQLLRVKG